MRTAFSIILSKLQLACLLGVMLVSRASASFTSMYVFGDGVSAINEDLPDDPLFYGKRNCNGRVWAEVMCQWHGRTFADPDRLSGFGNISEYVVADTVSFTAPSDVGTALFVIWCANADFVDYFNSDGTAWTSFIEASRDRHVGAVTNLYNKGARNFVMPNAVDIMATPFYNAYDPLEKDMVRQKVIEFNIAFKTAMTGLAASPSKPGIKIHLPDTYAFFKHVLDNEGIYGLTNPIPSNSGAYDAVNPSMNGNGSNYIFWDDYHPTAKFQMHLAAFFQQLIFPVKVNSISLSGPNVQIQLANVPLGSAGAIQGSANLQPPWAEDYPFTEPLAPVGSTTQTYSFAAVGPKRFYRAAFPVEWVWP